jgi:hypothetical protein
MGLLSTPNLEVEASGQHPALCIGYTLFLHRHHFVTVRCDVNLIACFVETMTALHLHKVLRE